MSKGKIKEFINPTGITQLSSIFLGLARIILCIYVLFTDPLSSGFGYLLILLFFISVTRHLLLYCSKPTSDNIYNFFLDLVSPCIFGFVLYHVLSVYPADFFSIAVSFFLPAIIYCLLFAGEPNQGRGTYTFWGGLFCYVLPFLLVLNYSFDSSNPVIEKYFLSKKYVVAVGSDSDGYSDNYYFDLIHTDSITTPPYWVEVDQKTCKYFHNSWMYKMIELGNATFMILDKKTASGHKHQCSFLLQEINGPIHKRVTTEQQYVQFEKGDTFNIEKHRGLLGIGWLTYR